MASRLTGWRYVETPPGTFGPWSFWGSDGLWFSERGDIGSPTHPTRRETLCDDGRHSVLCVRTPDGEKWSHFVSIDGVTHEITANETTEYLKSRIVSYLEATDGQTRPAIPDPDYAGA